MQVAKRIANAAWRMDEQRLQALSKALTHLVFRNGVVENLHADGVCLDNATMEKLNRDINNRFYTLLSIWFNGTDEEEMSLERTLNFLASSMDKIGRKRKKLIYWWGDER